MNLKNRRATNQINLKKPTLILPEAIVTVAIGKSPAAASSQYSTFLRFRSSMRKERCRRLYEFSPLPEEETALVIEH